MTNRRISTRNATFQQWQALLDNRSLRHRRREFLVQGVRPITIADRYGWPLRALIHTADRPLSRWAADLCDRADAPLVAMSAALIAELGQQEDGPPELVAVAALPDDDLDRITPTGRALVVAFDRPTSPGNLGTLVRSADAFGAAGLVVTGHAADPYDPRAVRASTGSLLALPVVRAATHTEVLAWVREHRRLGTPIQVVGTDERAERDLTEHDLTGPTLLVLGNETAGLSAGWRAGCDHTVRIPIGGAASSLNAAAAGTVVLYEADRQRRAGRPHRMSGPGGAG